MTKPDSLKPATLAVHAADYDDILPAIPTVPPVYFATAYTFKNTDDLDAVFDDPNESYAYGRYGNPTVRSLENMMAKLEGAEASIAYPSGMAAVNGVYSVLAKPGSSVIISRDVYGSSLGLIRSQYEELGVEIHILDVTNLDDVRDVANRVKPTMIYGETISNPLMKVTDISGLAQIAEESGAALVIDNTFGSPILSRPIDLGADLVLHSTTKYIAGHGDVIGGIVSGKKDLVDEMKARARVNGAVPGPMDAWLTVRGIHTLHLRMKAHSQNALEIATWLQQDDRIDAVNYPGLNGGDIPGQFLSDHRGGMLSFEIKGATTENAFKYLESLQLVKPATTLGDVSTVTLHPATSSQRGFAPEEREAWGIKHSLIRLSVGIEDASDIIADLDQAITAAMA